MPTGNRKKNLKKGLTNPASSGIIITELRKQHKKVRYKMAKVVYVMKNGTILDETIALIIKRFPCFVNRGYIEMDYSKVTVTCRAEDAASVYEQFEYSSLFIE